MDYSLRRDLSGSEISWEVMGDSSINITKEKSDFKNIVVPILQYWSSMLEKKFQDPFQQYDPTVLISENNI